jgi:hypothetical protein
MTTADPNAFVFISAPRSRRVCRAGGLDEAKICSATGSTVILTLIIVTVLGLGGFRLITWAFSHSPMERHPQQYGAIYDRHLPVRVCTARIWMLTGHHVCPGGPLLGDYCPQLIYAVQPGCA